MVTLPGLCLCPPKCHHITALNGIIPIQALTGQIPDITHFLQFSFWEPGYYKVDRNQPDHKFPSQSNEKRVHWAGFADNKGDQLTWRILTDDSQLIITRSSVRSQAEYRSKKIC